MKISKHFGTNWFTVVMGVGIVAALTYTSPIAFPGRRVIGVSLFALLTLVLLLSLGLWIARWFFHPKEALGDFKDPTRVLFYGALAMGINVFGNDCFLIAKNYFPFELVIHVSQIVWVVGVVVSLFSVLLVPFLLFVEHTVQPQETLASWLIPVVPTIVAAATGSNLIPYWGSPAVQFAITALILAMLGMTLFLFVMVSALVYTRLVYHAKLTGEFVPSVWVEIGPIGMSMSTFCVLPATTHAFWHTWDPALHMMGIFLSMILWGVGVWWILISLGFSLYHLWKKDGGIPYNLGWWAYVFPIGSFTAGTYALQHATQYSFFKIAGFVQLLMLVFFFILVAWRTGRALKNGTLLRWN